ncbi:MAG TPA: anthranilate synthase component I family protein [Puia sp.]|nr:anthranilate synthase component I family protein [Puia sp.]
MLSWASRFNISCFLDNHRYGLPAHSFECLLAVGARDSIQAPAGNAFAQLKDFAARHKDWLFGHLGYGLARETEPSNGHSDPIPNPAPGPTPNPAPTRNMPSQPDPIGFPDLFFFVPELLIELGPDTIRIGSFLADHSAILAAILDQGLHPHTPGPYKPRTGVSGAIPALLPRFTREEYLDTISRLQAHILRGDCYEINFCQEFFAQPATIDPLSTWFSLSMNSPNPFSAYYRIAESHLLCASPERYLRRTGNTLLSQPIKGTWPRSPGDPSSDEAGRDLLYASSKDRSENVMVVDLVRNDLSKICLPGSVRVEELYGIYTFPHVHQMISSVKGELPPDTGFVDCIRATFPMGSMTGAPKRRVVGLIEQYERSARGLFSGAVGYITPDGDFDFNVVIRSILYNQRDSYLSYQVGSGITFYSDPVSEYEECLLKAEGMKRALGLQ